MTASYIENFADEKAKEIFRRRYPKGYGIVLLEKTIEGAVGEEWLSIEIPTWLLDEIERLYKFDKLARDFRISWCFACNRHWTMAEISMAEISMVKLLPFVISASLCPHCCGNLKTDSDFRGLTYIDSLA